MFFFLCDCSQNSSNPKSNNSKVFWKENGLWLLVSLAICWTTPLKQTSKVSPSWYISTHPCSSLTDMEILRLCPNTWRAVRMSAHWTISPRGPPLRTLGLKTSPDSSVRKPTWMRICRREEKKVAYCGSSEVNVDRLEDITRSNAWRDRHSS